MQMNKISIVVALLVLLSSPAWAQGTSSKGIATVVLDGRLTPKVKMQAIEDARINALDRYFSQTHQANAKNYQRIRDDIVRNVSQYVLSVVILSEDIDGKSLDEAKRAKTGLYTIVVRADLDINRINNELTSQSVVANTAAADKSDMTFVFVARQQVSVQSFDDKVYKRTDVNANIEMNGSSSNSLTESEDIRSNSVTLRDSREVSGKASIDATVAVTSGGSTTAKSDVVKWDLMPTAGINTVMEGVFANAGFTVIDVVFLEEASGGLVDVDAIRNDYKTGDDLSPETLRNTTKGVRIAEIPYLALGTLDVGMKSIDPATGRTQVHVTVSGKVIDVSGRFPRTVSSVGPVRISGLGHDQSTARESALIKAAGLAAKRLVDQLNAKGIQ